MRRHSNSPRRVFRGRVERRGRRKSVVTNIGVKWQPLPPENRLTWREIVKEGERKWKSEGEEEAGGVWHYSITIRAVLDFPSFQNKETNFSQSHLPPSSLFLPLSWIPEEKSHYFSRQPGSLYPLPAPPFKRVRRITLSTVEFYYLSYAFFKYQVKLQKGVLFVFYYIFYTLKKKDMCDVCICMIMCITLLFCVLLYYPSIIMIMVKNVNVITVKMTVFPCSKWMVSNLVDLLQSRCNGY